MTHAREAAERMWLALDATLDRLGEVTDVAPGLPWPESDATAARTLAERIDRASRRHVWQDSLSAAARLLTGGRIDEGLEAAQVADLARRVVGLGATLRLLGGGRPAAEVLEGAPYASRALRLMALADIALAGLGPASLDAGLAAMLGPRLEHAGAWLTDRADIAPHRDDSEAVLHALESDLAALIPDAGALESIVGRCLEWAQQGAPGVVQGALGAGLDGLGVYPRIVERLIRHGRSPTLFEAEEWEDDLLLDDMLTPDETESPPPQHPPAEPPAVALAPVEVAWEDATPAQAPPVPAPAEPDPPPPEPTPVVEAPAPAPSADPSDDGPPDLIERALEVGVLVAPRGDVAAVSGKKNLMTKDIARIAEEWGVRVMRGPGGRGGDTLLLAPAARLERDEEGSAVDLGSAVGDAADHLERHGWVVLDEDAMLAALGYQRLGVRVRRALITWGEDAVGEPVVLWRGGDRLAITRQTSLS